MKNVRIESIIYNYWIFKLTPMRESGRNEESLTSVAAFEEILLPTRRDQNDRVGLMSLS